MKPRILFVLSEGLQATVIDSQVIQHARVLKELGVAEFKIVTLACSKEAHVQAQKYQEKATRDAGCEVLILRGVRPRLPFSEYINGLLLARLIKKRNILFDKIHARTEYTAAVCSFVVRATSKAMVWDCRGDAFAERVDRIPNGFKRLLVGALGGIVYNYRLRLASEAADSAIFVTSVLRDRMQMYWVGKKTAVIPGAASEKLFYFDKELRKSKRSILNISEDTLLLVYGGSMADYQKFSESLVCFDRLKESGVKVNYLVITNQKDKAKWMVEGRSGVIVQSAQLQEMNGYLNAADAAFMIRDYMPLNEAAFPTKFSEYGLCGLPVIMNMAVPDAYELAINAGNYVDCCDIASIKMFSDEKRSKVSLFYRERVTKQAQSSIYKYLYE
ncbi:MAG: hypothetical protein VX620_16360 [Pseudomonadota bacterium]|nr:hypothetical protein [Pseudomonadota bacterium]